MRLFAYLHIGPRLFAIFSNGIAYEPAPGTPLDFKLAVDVNIYPIIAHKIGHMHRVLRYLNLFISCSSCIMLTTKFKEELNTFFEL